MTSQAIVLLSGGLDSATTLAIARHDGHHTHALSFRYGQRHAVELDAARRVATHLGATSHHTVDIDLTPIGGSALTDPHIPVPDSGTGPGGDSGIPATYVPARNTIFLSYALAYAEVCGAANIYLGVNAVDYSGYPDCRPEYIAAFETMANLATRAGVSGHRLTIHTPLIHLSKAEIIQRGLDLGVNYGLTHSCYNPDGRRPCRRCDSCTIREAGFTALGLTDPAVTP